MEKLYPVYLDLREKKCLVVGGGAVAERKVDTLLKCRAVVTVVSPVVTSYLKELEGIGYIKWVREPYHLRYLENATLVIGSTGNEMVNRQVAQDCFERNIMVNIVDVPELCSFFVPSLVSRGPLSIAVSTEGKSPAFARRLREELEEIYTEEHGKFVSYLGELRSHIQEEVSDPQKRKDLFTKLANEEFFRLFQNLPIEVLEEAVATIIARFQEGSEKNI